MDTKKNKDSSTLKKYNIITKNNPKSTISEAYRTIRTNIQFSGTGKPIRTIMVTSAVPDEGKSTIAVNLSVVFANAGYKVLIIDCDFRNPCLRKIFNLNSVGFSNVIVGGKTIEEAIQHSDIKNLDVVASGHIPPNPSEILNSSSVVTLLEKLKTMYEYIIIDTPPLLPVTDATIMATKVDGVIQVVCHDKISPGEAKEAMKRLQKPGVHVIGAILNNVKIGNRYGYGYHGYGYHGYGYGYAYGEVYGAEDATEKEKEEQK